MSKLNDGQLRQGDVLLCKRETLPVNATPVETTGPLALKHGEATGHFHRYEYAAESRLYVAHGGTRYLSVAGATIDLTHQEHDTIPTPPGVYDLPVQMEWQDSNEPIQVAD